MSITTNNIKLNLSKTKNVQREDKWIEQDVIVPDNMPDALKIINITSHPYINDYEINNGKIKIVGKINYNIIYRANDEGCSVRGLNVSYPYTTTIEKVIVKDPSNLVIDSKLKNIIYSLPNERKIAIKNEVSFCIEIMENTNVDIIKEFPKNEDIEFNKCKSSFNNIKQKKKTYITSTEDVLLKKENDAIYEILKVKPKIKDTELKESYNKIMLKGIIEIKMLYVGEEKRINSEILEVPFSSMIELENITDKSKYDISYNLRDLNVRINPDIEQRTLNVDYKIENNVVVYEPEEIEYIDDFYSKTRELKYDVKNMQVAVNNNKIQKEITITDTLSDIIQENNRMIDYDIDTSNVNTTLTEDGINVSGIAKLNLITQNRENGELDNKTIDIMVEQNFPFEEAWKNSNISMKIKDTKLNVIQNGNSIDIKIVIVVELDIEETLSISSIENISEEPLNLKDISSINIYIVKPGDSVWKIAKKYKTSMNNIIKTNNLENPDYIEVGQKILIIR